MFAKRDQERDLFGIPNLVEIGAYHCVRFLKYIISHASNTKFDSPVQTKQIGWVPSILFNCDWESDANDANNANNANDTNEII